MVDLPEVDRVVRLLRVEMQAGKAQNGMQQPLIVRFHGHSQHDFLKRVRDVVMDGQDLTQMVGEMVQEATVHVGFDARGDVSWRSAQVMRNDRVCLVLARALMGGEFHRRGSVGGLPDFPVPLPGRKNFLGGYPPQT